MSRAPYDAYQEAQAGWFSRVPAHWAITQVRYVADVINGYPFDSSRFSEEGFPLVRIRDLGMEETETRYNGEFIEAASVSSDDVLIGMDGDFNVGRWKGNGRALLNQRMCCVRGHDPMVSRFLEYLLPIPLQQLNDVTFSTTVKHLSSRDVERFPLALPPAGELRAIVSALDRETAKLDALVAEQERLLSSLAQKTQALITSVISRGMERESPRPRRSTNLGWLGEIPATWDLKRLKHLSPGMTVGIVVNPSDYVADEGLPFIYGGDIREGAISWQSARRILPEASALQAKTQLREGDLLCVRVGAPGVTAVVPKECDGGNCASVLLIRRGDFNSAWLCYAMNSRVVRFQVELVQYGAAQEQFNVSHAVNFWLPVPPRSEQDAIADYLDRAAREHGELATEVERATHLLLERKAALITAAVTGRMDVRNYYPSESLAPVAA